MTKYTARLKTTYLIDLLSGQLGIAKGILAGLEGAIQQVLDLDTRGQVGTSTCALRSTLA